MEPLIGIAVTVLALAVSAGLGVWLVWLLLRAIEPTGSSAGVLRGGTWVGILERLAITGAILAGHPAVIAVVVAVKGLGRYPELQATAPEHRAKVTERFIIGTLASYLWAGAVGVLGSILLDGLL